MWDAVTFCSNFVRHSLAGCSPALLCSWVLHVIDTNPNSLSARGWLEDTSKVQKYVMSDADYDARENTYRRHKAQKVKVLTNQA